jgi:uncharacterized membrane protein YhaH (DUF805 family)
MVEWMLLPYRRLYRAIEGRATRSEYWWFMLMVLAVYVAFLVLMLGMGVAGSMTNPNQMSAMMAGAGSAFMLLIIPFYIWAVLTSAAAFAVAIRRIHDMGYSGWFLALYYVGFFIVALLGGALGMVDPRLSFTLFFLYWLAGILVMALPGTKGPNKYGEDPLGVAKAQDVFS